MVAKGGLFERQKSEETAQQCCRLLQSLVPCDLCSLPSPSPCTRLLPCSQPCCRVYVIIKQQAENISRCHVFSSDQTADRPSMCSRSSLAIVRTLLSVAKQQTANSEQQRAKGCCRTFPDSNSSEQKGAVAPSRTATAAVPFTAVQIFVPSLHLVPKQQAANSTIAVLFSLRPLPNHHSRHGCALADSLYRTATTVAAVLFISPPLRLSD
ncbi:uncharacterized protein LOC112513816 [Cynara cardunculus var. scolymus]|uniref:uncharacterized protein LOC112513816 n=1 Tax=Cynara cardunculus var. scolymus TaxID=59895 RepID=UPI000D626AA3|nr:uncharacterized protein LOC112513816 [Cynara cardunculus var. scolymus]